MDRAEPSPAAAEDRPGRRPLPLLLPLAGIVAAAASLRFWRLGAEALWNDEGFSWWWSQQSLAELWGAPGRVETNPPLYYTLQHLCLAFGDSEAALRSPAAVFGVLAVPLAFQLGRVVAGGRAGLLAAALVATSGVHLYYSQEARAYTLLAAAANAAVLGLLLVLRRHSDRRLWPAGATDAPGRTAGSDLPGLALYALGTGVALYAHNTAVLLPALANVVAVAWWLGPARRSRRFLLAWIGANLVPLAAWLWWLPTVIAQARGAATIAWIEQPATSWAAFEALRLYGLRYVEGGRVLALLPLLPAVPALAAVPWRRVPATLVLLAFVVGVPWLTYAAGLVATPLWIERTLLWPVPLGLVLVAAGTVRLRPRWLAAGVAGLLVAARLVDLALYATTVKKPPLAAAAAELADAWRPGDGLLLVPGATQLPLAYYLHRDGLPFAALAVESGAGDEALEGAYRERPVGPPLGQPLQGMTLDQLTGLPERYRRVWVLFRREEKADPGGRVLARLRELGTVAAERHFEPRLDLALVVLAAPGRR